MTIPSLWMIGYLNC